MKIDGFLKVPDINGESKRKGHEDQLEIYGIEFDMESPTDINTGSRRGRVDFSGLTVTKNYDKGSPYLAQALFLNKSFDKVEIFLRRTIATESKDYLVVTLEKASVRGYWLRPSPVDEGLLEETVEFAYQIIEFNYDGKDIATMDVHVAV